MEECCGNCKFGFDIYPDKLFSKKDVESSVLCHRFPPSYRSITIGCGNNTQLISGMYRKSSVERTIWAVVNKGDWCGEYKPKAEHK